MHSLMRVVRIPIRGGRSAGPGLEVDVFKVGIFSEMSKENKKQCINEKRRRGIVSSVLNLLKSAIHFIDKPLL